MLMEEERFARLLAETGRRIYKVGGDGNCLFRAVAHQLYGNEEHHWMIRQHCLDYVESEREYFAQYIIGGLQSFHIYVARKREDGVWGDDVEIQALSEIYDRPIEVYAYSKVPMRTFHESHENESAQPIRLSYHGKSHFNSIMPFNENEHSFLRSRPGVVEQSALSQARVRRDEN